jgi:hypothetical protein
LEASHGNSGQVESGRVALCLSLDAPHGERFRRLRGGSAILLMFMLAGGAATTWGQLDPNDPWPKFAHDQRNTCYTTHVGPHAKPQIRWWARLDEDPDSALSHHLRGPVVARLGENNIRYVLVGTYDEVDAGPPIVYDGRVLVFRFHPDNNHWGDGELEALPVAVLPVDGPVSSTPLVMPNDWVAVQTETHIEVWNLHNPGFPARLWKADLVSHGSSPAYGPMLAAGGDGYLYVLGDGGKLYCVDPEQDPDENGEVDLATVREWSVPLATSDQGGTSPAIGPIADDPHFNPRNFVYVSLLSGEGLQHLFALFADGNGNAPVAWSHGIENGGGLMGGTFASPSVHHATAGEAYANQLVIGSDDSCIYGFVNECQDPEDGRWPRRWFFRTDECVSGTAGLTPEGEIIVWNEDSSIVDLADQGDDEYAYTGSTALDNGTGWVHGAPVLDSAGRFYVNTPDGGYGGDDAALVLAYEWPIVDDEPRLWDWGWEDDMPVVDLGPPKVLVPRLGFGGPCADDVDGTLLCASYGYLFALRPPLGDFAGNGGADIGDLGAMRTALLDPLTWDEQYGAVYGINLLGVADADNDDAFTLSDVAALIDAMANGDNDSATDEDWTAFREAVDALYDDVGMEE